LHFLTINFILEINLLMQYGVFTEIHKLFLLKVKCNLHYKDLIENQCGLRDVDVGEVEARVLQEFVGVFANPGLDMMASNVMPLDAIVVEVVEDSNAGLVGAVLRELPVVGLGGGSTTGVGPVSPPSGRGVGGWDACVGTRPEPAVHNMRHQIGSVTPIEVTLPAARPDVANVAKVHLLVDEVCFLLGLQAHQILTVLSADVAGVEPVALVALGGLVDPGEEVVLVVAEGAGVLHPVGARLRLRPDQLSLRRHHSYQGSRHHQQTRHLLYLLAHTTTH